MFKIEKTLERFTSTVSHLSSTSTNSMCRICLEGEGCENLLAPCKCTGTVALIHKTCLEHWLTSSNSGQCEICKHEFKITREPKSFRDYVYEYSNKIHMKNFIVDLVCFFLLTPLIVVSTYLCSAGANQYFVDKRWEAFGLVALSLFLIAIYIIWCHFMVKYHLNEWTKWQNSNQQIRLVELAEQGRSKILENDEN